MRSSNKAVLSVALAALAGAAVAGDATSEFKKWYKAGIPQVVKAFAKRDIHFFDKMSAPDFVYVDFKGAKQKKKEAIQGLQQMLSSAKSIVYKPRIVSTKVTGNKAVVNLDEHYRMQMLPGPDKKSQVMEVRGAVQETWENRKGKWTIVMIKELKEANLTMDGKPYKPPAMVAQPPGKSGG